MARAVLITGSNAGDRQYMLDAARGLLARRTGKIEAVSAVYESEPWGDVAAEYGGPGPHNVEVSIVSDDWSECDGNSGPPQSFLNQAIVLDTELSPDELLNAIHCIEAELGRVRPELPDDNPDMEATGNKYGDEGQTGGGNGSADIGNADRAIKCIAGGCAIAADSAGNVVGRQGAKKRIYFSRTIDIDILFYDDIVVVTPRLTIPHPLIAEREFVLVPLAEIMPRHIHPVSRKTVNRLLCELRNRI